MAISVMSFTKYSDSVIFIRLMRYVIKKQKCFNFSTAKVLAVDKGPVKYTTNKAARIPISHTIGFYHRSAREKPWYEPHVLIASFFSVLVYFFFLRSENEIDEILKGNQDYKNPKVELMILKSKLNYCEKNKLPVHPLKAKIKELEEELNIRSF